MTGWLVWGVFFFAIFLILSSIMLFFVGRTYPYTEKNGYFKRDVYFMGACMFIAHGALLLIGLRLLVGQNFS